MLFLLVPIISILAVSIVSVVCVCIVKSFKGKRSFKVKLHFSKNKYIEIENAPCKEIIKK
ncbi:MAG: hypothetical protein FWE74_03550 [Oscillospiraceae bacterium]|nr:hypothetical protein [Oscillospiraceae bacterium]